MHNMGQFQFNKYATDGQWILFVCTVKVFEPNWLIWTAKYDARFRWSNIAEQVANESVTLRMKRLFEAAEEATDSGTILFAFSSI